MSPVSTAVQAFTHPLALILIVAFSTASFTTFLAVARPSYPGWRSWSAALVLLSLGVSVGLARTPQTYLLCVLLGNALIALSSICAVAAYRRFTGLPHPLERAWLLTLPFLAGAFLWFTLVQDVIAVRVALINTYSVSAALTIIALCLRQARRQPSLRAAYLFSALVFAVFLATSLPRALTAFLLPPAQFTAPSFVTALYYLSVLLLITAGTFAMFLLHDDRRRLEVAALQAELHQLTVTDPLTGLANRRGLAAHFTALRHADQADAVSVVVLDIDHFKALNDRFGHPAGDACLRHLAHILARATRAGDAVARFGGEEFVLILRGTALTGAVEVVGRIQQQLRHPTSALPAFTVSAGVVEGRTGASLEDLIGQADARMYEAKRRGRNTECAGDLRPS